MSGRGGRRPGPPNWGKTPQVDVITLIGHFGHGSQGSSDERNAHLVHECDRRFGSALKPSWGSRRGGVSGQRGSPKAPSATFDSRSTRDPGKGPKLVGQLGLGGVQILVEELRDLGGHGGQSRAEGRRAVSLNVQLVAHQLQLLVQTNRAGAYIHQLKLSGGGTARQCIEQLDERGRGRDHGSVHNQDLALNGRGHRVFDPVRCALGDPSRDGLTRCEERGIHAVDGIRVWPWTAGGAPIARPGRVPRQTSAVATGTNAGLVGASSQVSRWYAEDDAGHPRDSRRQCARGEAILRALNRSLCTSGGTATRAVGPHWTLGPRECPLPDRRGSVPRPTGVGQAAQHGRNPSAGACRAPESRPGGPPQVVQTGGRQVFGKAKTALPEFLAGPR